MRWSDFTVVWTVNVYLYSKYAHNIYSWLRLIYYSNYKLACVQKGLITNNALIALDLPLVIDEAGRWLIVPNTHRWCQLQTSPDRWVDVIFTATHRWWSSRRHALAAFDNEIQDEQTEITVRSSH